MKLDDFQRYLVELRSLPPEVPLDPELKPQRAKLDKRIREEQALASGAVLTAVLEQGQGGGSPREGDLVYVHYSIRDLEDELLYSTRSEEGGPGQAFAFLIEKGVRVPRGWELALRDMTRGQRNVIQVKPGFGFRHPDCALKPPVRGLPLDQPLRFDLSLLNWYPAASVHHYGSSDHPLYKRCLKEATSWESPRPPFEVTLHLTVCCPAYDGLQLTGQRLFSTSGRQPLTLQLGRGLLPPAVEDALSYMSKDERAAFVVSAAAMRPGDDGKGSDSESDWDTDGDEEEEEEASGAGRRHSHAAASTSDGRGPGGRAAGKPGARGVGAGGPCLVPPPPARCTQVELEVELLSMVQVRDMTGTGEVTKKRVREGTGEFPIDCPLNDTTLRLHFRVRPLGHAGLPPAAAGADAAATAAAGAAEASSGGPVAAAGSGKGPGGAGEGGGGTGVGGSAAAGAGAGAEEPPGGGPEAAAAAAAADAAEGSGQQAFGSGSDGAGSPAQEGWVYDSRTERGGEPLTVDTGCGELPEALEMALKLMVPGEVSRVVAAPRFAYEGREDCPTGIPSPGTSTVEFEVELMDFEREGHWQNLTFEERYALAERLKSKGNELFKKQQSKFAKARYDRLLRLLESTRDYETQEQVDRIDGYKVATLGNVALCCVQMGEYVAAAAACDKALQYEPENAKLHFRKGKALSLNGDHEAAAEALKLALEYDPSSEKDIKTELAANAERQKAALRKQKRDLGNFLKK